jgi:hypothetical protein
MIDLLTTFIGIYGKQAGFPFTVFPKPGVVIKQCGVV